MTRCAIYDRVSTDIQVLDGISLEAQQSALIQYANERSYKIVDVYTDEGITARKKLENRKEFQRLMNDVRHDKIDIILVTKLDRWFRNIKDYHNTQSVLEAHNCNWKTIFEEYDTTTANGRFAINIMLSVNENECDRDSDRIKEVFKYKKSKGEWLGGKPPYGYMRDESQHLVKNPDTAPIVQEMFDLYFNNYSKRQTVQYILEKYSNTPAGSNLTKMFYREAYTGYRDGIQICEPFLSIVQFNKIKTVSDSRRWEKIEETYLFSSLIKCPHCHQKMIACTSEKKKPSGKTYRYKVYNCMSKWTEKHIKPCIYESTVEKYLINNINNEINKQIEFRERVKSETKPVDIKKIKLELSRLNMLFQKGRIDESYYDNEYDRLNIILNSHKKTGSNLEIFLDAFLGNWVSLYEELELEDKKTFWKEYIETIYLDEKSHKISGLKFCNGWYS